MSETGSTMAEALERLHAKTAEAVHNHISTYGIQPIRNIKKRSGNVSDSSSSGTSSSDSELDVLSNVSISSSSDSSDDDKPSKRRPGRPRPRVNVDAGRPVGRAMGPPRGYPRPGMAFTAAGMAPRVHPGPVVPQPGFRPPGAPVFAPAAAGSDAPKPPRDVRLYIRWPGRGEARVVDSCPPTRKGLGNAALRYCRTNLHVFPMPQGPHSPPPGPALPFLRATIRRAVVGADSYDISAYASEDLSHLWELGGLPLFEIELQRSMPPPPGRLMTGPPPPPGLAGKPASAEGASSRPGSPSRKNSVEDIVSS